MIGDSLEVDIAGGQNAGMDTVHVRFKEEDSPVVPTYTITSLKELEGIL